MKKIIFVALCVILVFGKDLYIKPEKANIRTAPNGKKIGTLNHGTHIKILKTQGKWAKVSLDGWIKKNLITNNLKQDSKKHHKSKLELVKFDISVFPKDIEDGRFSDVVYLTLYVKNNTSKRIKAWRAHTIVKNSFGDVLLKLTLTDGSANIAPGATEAAPFGWENNPFISDEPYDKLTSYSKENLKVFFDKEK